MKLKSALWLSIACMLCLGAGQAQAAPITTLFNTGVDAFGNVRANGVIGDLHYTLLSPPLGSTTDIRIRDSSGGFPIPPYTADNGSSRWIGPDNDSSLTSPLGTYTYETSFDLTGFNPLTALVSGTWLSDNNGLDILINGTSLGFTTVFASFAGPSSPFAINSGFISGINTIRFVVNNGSVGAGSIAANPTALRVEMTGTASVPEPASLMLLGAGLAAIGIWRRKAAK